MAKWDHPVSHEFFALADIFDLQHRIASDPKKPAPKPYPRPLPEKASKVERFGELIDPADLPDVLRAFGREVPEALLS